MAKRASFIVLAKAITSSEMESVRKDIAHFVALKIQRDSIAHPLSMLHCCY